MRLIASGVVLYLLYILYIGGDFMSGRFFSAPLIFSLVGLLSFIKRLPAPQKVAFAAVVVLTGWISPSSPITYFGSVPESESAIPAAETGIWDERQFYYESTGLFMLTHELDLPDHVWVEQGRRLRERQVPVVEERAVGMLGFYAGPNVYVLDTLALGDPFLARLPARLEDWRVGHYEREPVEGYVESLRSNENRIADPDLARYYEKLRVIIRGDLWSLDRLRTIWEMNTGRYDHLLADYRPTR